MYCDPARRYIGNSTAACAVGHVGDGIFATQKWLGLPDFVGIVYPPYYPTLFLVQTIALLLNVFFYLIVLPIIDLRRQKKRWENLVLDLKSFVGFTISFTEQCTAISSILAFIMWYELDSLRLGDYSADLRHTFDRKPFWQWW